MATPEASPRPDMSARARASIFSSPPAPNSDLGNNARPCSATELQELLQECDVQALILLGCISVTSTAATGK